MTNSPSPRWSEARARDWWDRLPWICGFNFLPSSAVNFLEMWSEASFDKEVIDRELGWAAEVGFNAVRTNLHFLVWRHDPDGLIERLDWFLETARRHGLAVMPVLFDDCGFGGAEPGYGPQPQPVPTIHNSRAVASPGRAAVMDRAQWPEFRRYVQHVISTYKDDPRVLLWDLYNEPGNRMIFTHDGNFALYDAALVDHSGSLMVEAFGWAREISPSQPLTVAAWRTPPVGSNERAFAHWIDQRALALSDVISFHAYCDRADAQKYIDLLSQHGRPMMSTEWMARPVDSRISDQLALYHDRKVGCFNWGLVQGRTQTHLPWPRSLEVQHGRIVDEDAWFHDILRSDGTPYDRTETDLIKALTRPSNIFSGGKECLA